MARPTRYLLDPLKQAYPVSNLLLWAHTYEALHRAGEAHVGQDEVPGRGRVSTLFLGVDFRCALPCSCLPPLLFETVTLHADGRLDQQRCSTWQEAEIQHAAALRALKAGPVGGEHQGKPGVSGQPPANQNPGPDGSA